MQTQVWGVLTGQPCEKGKAHCSELEWYAAPPGLSWDEPESGPVPHLSQGGEPESTFLQPGAL